MALLNVESKVRVNVAAGLLESDELPLTDTDARAECDGERVTYGDAELVCCPELLLEAEADLLPVPLVLVVRVAPIVRVSETVAPTDFEGEPVVLGEALAVKASDALMDEEPEADKLATEL